MEFLYSGTSELRTHLLSFVERSSSPQTLNIIHALHGLKLYVAVAGRKQTLFLLLLTTFTKYT